MMFIGFRFQSVVDFFLTLTFLPQLHPESIAPAGEEV